MSTKNNIDSKQVEELNSKFEALEIKHNTLIHRIRELEKVNKHQSTEINKLNRQQRLKGRNATPLSRASFKVGDFVQVTNRYKGQFGVIGRVYSVTRAQVHFTDIKEGGGSVSRAFHNVKLLHLSKQEKDNLSHGARKR